MGILITSTITGVQRNLRQKRVRIAEDELQRGGGASDTLSSPQRLRRRNARHWSRADMIPSRSVLNSNSYSSGLPTHELLNNDASGDSTSSTDRVDNSLLIRQWERRAGNIRRRLGEDINFDFTNLNNNEPSFFTNLTQVENNHDNNHDNANDNTNTNANDNDNNHERGTDEEISQRLNYESRRRALGQVRRLRERLSRGPPPRATSPRGTDAGHHVSFNRISDNLRSIPFERTDLPLDRRTQAFGHLTSRYPFGPTAESMFDDAEGEQVHNENHQISASYGGHENIHPVLMNGPFTATETVSSSSTEIPVRIPLPLVNEVPRRRRNSFTRTSEQRTTSPSMRNRNRHATVTAIDDDDGSIIWTLHH